MYLYYFFSRTFDVKGVSTVILSYLQLVRWKPQRPLLCSFHVIHMSEDSGSAEGGFN
uniref:Uncharacterized protein n=1 Tax=Kalanchoe fedtschenkoi TaxID=63787 RepID=A0A7N0T3K8_KALFE